MCLQFPVLDFDCSYSQEDSSDLKWIKLGLVCLVGSLGY